MKAREFITENETIVYHGNQGGIHKDLVTPMWWTTSKEDAIQYATQNDGNGFVFTAKLNCKKPYVLQKNEETNQVVSQYKKLIEKGYDCIIDPEVGDYIPLSNKDIKIIDREEVGSIDEAPLPPDWDPEKLNLRQTYKDRLRYALDRAKRLGGGSSRVAMTIDYEGRPTVLKVAKNAKGLAQNEAEIEILEDGYAGGLPIVIPLIDYDKANKRPVWLQTELAQKTSSIKLNKLLHTPALWFLTDYVGVMLGKSTSYRANATTESLKKYYFDNRMWKNTTPTEKDWEIFTEYASELADLVSSTPLELGDLNNPSNWGIYNNRPVVIDLGFTEDTAQLYGFKKQ